MTLLIRPARPDDESELAAMLGEIFDYFESLAPDEPLDRPDRETLARTAALSFAKDPVCATLIAERAGRPVGYLAYYFGIWEVHPALHVAGLFVRRAARGAGVGRALMAEARKLAADRGATHMAWLVWRRNAPAQAFYKGLGADFADEDVLMTMRVG